MKKLITITVALFLIVNSLFIPFYISVSRMQTQIDKYVEFIEPNIAYVEDERLPGLDQAELQALLDNWEKESYIESVEIIYMHRRYISLDDHEYYVSTLIPERQDSLKIISGRLYENDQELVISSNLPGYLNKSTDQLLGSQLGDYTIVGMFEDDSNLINDQLEIKYGSLNKPAKLYNVPYITYTKRSSQNIDSITYASENDDPGRNVDFFMLKITFANDDTSQNIAKFNHLTLNSTTTVSKSGITGNDYDYRVEIIGFMKYRNQLLLIQVLLNILGIQLIRTLIKDKRRTS